MPSRIRSLLSAAAVLPCAVPISAQESRAVLDAPLVMTTDRYGVVLDLDGDGDQDAVSWWDVNGGSLMRIRNEMNLGNGRLVAGPEWLVAADTTGQPPGFLRMRACDLDRDARADWSMVVNGGPSGGQSFCTAYQSLGAAHPREVLAYRFDCGGAPIAATYVDFDGDGVLDVALAIGTQLQLWSYAPVAGGDPVRTLRTAITLPGAADDLFPIEANGDALPDLYVNVGGQGRLVTVHADFTTGAVIPVPHGIASMPMPVAGDVDADGDEDLVVFGMSSYVTWRRTGATTWSPEAAVAGGPATNLCDVDADGDLDGVCCGGGPGTVIRNRGASTFRVSINQGGGVFAPAQEIPGLGADHIAGAADMDGDGDIDLVGGRCIYYARGPIGARVAPSVRGLGSLWTPARVHDVDGDGDPDFRLSAGDFLRNLAWDVQPLRALGLPGTGVEITGGGFPGDFTGDGRVDLLVVRRPQGGPVALWLYANDGGGGFVDAGRAGPEGLDFSDGGGSPRLDLVADADGDGDLDLVMRRYQASDVHWNDGTGRFLGPATAVAGCLATHAADFDGDGFVDLLSPLAGPQIFYGTAAGFGPGVPYGPVTTFSPALDSLDAGDLDLDGDLDLVLGHANSSFGGPVAAYWNRGGRAFEREEIATALLESSSVTCVADLNADGLLDVVSGPAVGTNSAAHVILRRSDGSGWEAPVQQAIHTEIQNSLGAFVRATAADVDLDGDLDLVTDRVLRNTRWHGAGRGQRVQDETSHPGSGGIAPTLNAIGPWHVGATAEIRLSGAWPQSVGILTSGWADTQAPFGGGGGPALPAQRMRFHSAIDFATRGPAGIAGAGGWTLEYAVPPWKAGRTYVYRAWVDDPASPGGQVSTNAVRVTYGT